MNLNFIENEVTITFTRIPNIECIGYEIYSHDENEETLITYIKNPRTNTNIFERKEYEYNEDLKFDLPDDVIAASSNDIKVYINNVEINISNYAYDDYKKRVEVYKDTVIENDLIEIEYKVDRIKYIHVTNKAFKYRVKPIYEKNFIIGQHSLL